jgi:hypothetical protein
MPKWDSNPRSECWSGWRQFVPLTARPLRSAKHTFLTSQLYRHLWADCLDSVWSLTSQNLIVLRGLLRGKIYSFTFTSRNMRSVKLSPRNLISMKSFGKIIFFPVYSQISSRSFISVSVCLCLCQICWNIAFLIGYWRLTLKFLCQFQVIEFLGSPP